MTGLHINLLWSFYQEVVYCLVNKVNDYFLMTTPEACGCSRFPCGKHQHINNLEHPCVKPNPKTTFPFEFIHKPDQSKLCAMRF